VGFAPSGVIFTRVFDAHHKTHGREIADTEFLSSNLLKKEIDVGLQSLVVRSIKLKRSIVLLETKSDTSA